MHTLVMIIVCACVPSLQGQSDQQPKGGVFIPRNGGWEGRIGLSSVFFSERKGGTAQVISGTWPNLEEQANLDMVFEVVSNDGNPIEVRQSFDQSPNVLFLEEGNQRIGIRMLFNLYDAASVLHGHGMTETWLYPDGQVFVTAAAMFENRAGHEAVTKGRLDIVIPKGLQNSSMKEGDMMQPHQNVKLILGDAADKTGLSLYWRTGKMEHNTYVYRSSFGKKGAPVYFRWPDYYRQAYTQRTLPDYIDPTGEKASWPPGRGSFIDRVVPTDYGVSLHWPVDSETDNATASFSTVFRLGMTSDPRSFADAEKEPIAMGLSGAVVHGNDRGYNDQEGCYEVRKTGQEEARIELPSDPLGREVRIKIIGLTGHGAVTASIDGKALVPQLTTDGGIADDPLAPIHDQPEAPANAALVSVKLGNSPQSLVVREEAGIQLVYQSRDPRRNYMIYSSKTGPQWSGLEFSLLDGHARHMRSYGEKDWALTENLLHWFAYMGYSPEQMIDELRDFEVLKNGPDEIIFKYTSNNANDGAQSEFVVKAQADAPAMQIDVHAKFTVLQQWPYKSVQFFDVFPFKGVEPQDWWYDHVLFMDSELKWRSFKTLEQEYEGQQDKQSIGATFQGLFGSDRGNMLMLTKNFTPNLPTHYVICGNYIDLHSSVKFDDLIKEPYSLEKGYEIEVDYELAIWGDSELTRDDMIEIGKNSIKNQKLILPDQIGQ